MSWRLPKDFFGAEADDQVMMQEILELLAMDVSNNSPGQAGSMTARSCTDLENRHGSLGTEFNRSSALSASINLESLNEEKKNIVDFSSIDDVGGPASWGGPIKKTSTGNNTSSVEEISPAGQEAVQQLTESAVGLAEQTQMQDSMPSSLTPRTLAASARLPMSINPSDAVTPRFYAGDPRVVSGAFAMDRPRTPMSGSVPVVAPTPEIPSIPGGSSVPNQKKRSPSTSKVLPTGQRVHLMSSAEFNELRRKLRMQTASRRYRKRRKEQLRHDKMQIQELQGELARLHEIESQCKQYQQRSVESLQNELELHENEATSLAKKIQDAAKVELDWVELMSEHLRKKRQSTVKHCDIGSSPDLGPRPPQPTDLFEMTVNEMLVIPEIQEILKRAPSKNEFMSTAASAAGIRETIAESQPDDSEEQVQVHKQDLSERHQLQSSPPAGANTTKEPKSKPPGMSLINSDNPTAKVVHKICAIEQDDLHRKDQVQQSDNMDVSHQQHELQESRSELSRLLHIEAQLKEYEKRSVESLEIEFQMLQQEVANLSGCMQVALQEELDWLGRMKDYQRKR